MLFFDDVQLLFPFLCFVATSSSGSSPTSFIYLLFPALFPCSHNFYFYFHSYFFCFVLWYATRFIPSVRFHRFFFLRRNSDKESGLVTKETHTLYPFRRVFNKNIIIYFVVARSYISHSNETTMKVSMVFLTACLGDTQLIKCPCSMTRKENYENHCSVEIGPDFFPMLFLYIFFSFQNKIERKKKLLRIPNRAIKCLPPISRNSRRNDSDRGKETM